MTLPLLEPTILNGVVESFTTPENLVLSNMLPSADYPTATITWDIYRGSRKVAKPNVPNSEAHIVDRLGRGRATATMVYYREKKIFVPTTTMWLRQLGTIGSIERANDAILREVNDLNVRLANKIELDCWKALTGTLPITYENGATVNIDYQFKTTHKPSPSVDWSANSTTAEEIATDVDAWQRLILRDSGVPATDAFVTAPTLGYIFSTWARTGNGTLLSEDMKNQYWRTRTLPGFLGLNWHVVEGWYEDDSGTTQLFVPDNAIFLANLTADRPIEIAWGPTADFGAPQGSTGKFMKTWEEEDPSGRQALLEAHYLPLIFRPDQFLYVADVTTP